MQSAIKSGLDGSGVLPGKLKLMRKAQILFQASADTLKKRHIDKKNVLLMAYAFAVSETNASGGVVVTAPTCGACGVLPAILKFSQDTLKVSENKIIEALAVAGLIGNIARTNATIAGAEGGCQAEVGVACAMAAAAYSHLIGSSNSQIFQAASVALEHHLGLTCDPVLGYVQSPCIERNAFAAIRALDAANYTSLMQIKVLFNYDDILETMLETGRALNAGYRETSTAGLASIYNKKKLSKTFKKKFDIKIT
jgi:L-serine dehydratase